MKKKTTVKKTKKDENWEMPAGKVRIVKDFLPSPEELFPKDNKVKITIVLDKETLLFFKGLSRKNGVKYQKMIRELLKQYVSKYSA
jgi:predicted DNA binding CopG/RHH family protein